MPKKRKETYLNPIGQRINNIISYFRIDIKNFAKKIYYSPSYVSDIMSGKKKLTKRVIKNIVEAFNINEHWLLTGEGEMFNKDQGVIAEDTPEYQLPERLQELIQRLKTVYLNGTDDEKIKVHGTIDFISSEIDRRKEASSSSVESKIARNKAG